MKILVKRDSSNYIAAAATDKNYTPEQIEFIIEHGNDKELCDLIDQTRDEGIMVELLGRGCSISVRQYIAMYTNDIDTIYTLLRDKSKNVKSWIYRRISSND